ncbi:DsbE family thiol:disulfide interchange protein [Agitococcus lubricus]|uniref:Cytochrome c biogenesis protein CcmG/thiol:disulfide interchange protein DsbE n=1 Tax=Agitococcus lubricus TaxID=1077255 RepID=A0A2T5IZC4_9GAMM|nr:DsbE family thiol:disulfide interchange protein [Agitococcus lubricus]PTQ89360.1 cytochrome c biogenesis protein CcmG/thiol:disulfide interchange protein DsbE [Agitococcus lubricus]
MKMRGLIWAIPLVLFLAVSAFLMTRLGEDPTNLPSARVGKPFPEFNLPSLDDERLLTVSDIKGKPALLNVWASWCPSCKEEHPTLNKLADMGIPVLGLNYKDQEQDAENYLAQRGNPYALIIADQKGNLGLDLGVYGAPETYLIDANAHIRYRFVGVLDEKVWQTQLEPCYTQLVAGGDAPSCQ